MGLRSILHRVAYGSLVPAELRRRHRACSNPVLLEQLLREHYFSQPINCLGPTPTEYLETSEGKTDLANQMFGRLSYDREVFIPWLNSVKSLRGLKLLEVGCGTGCSTVALLEQGADVTAVDVNAGNLEMARERCRLYGLGDPKFICMNATEIRGHHGQFDLIIFFATLEHLTLTERMQAMRETWNMLPRGGLWAVIETPNRLWWLDDHTSGLPFYHWLPDELAMQYADRSERPFMHDYTRKPDPLDFARRGRGVSYHEFELTMGEDWQVESALWLYLRRRNLAYRMKWLLGGRRYASMLRRHGPRIHDGFYQPYLDLVIRRL